MNHKPYRFFLGANSSQGFVSFFENALEDDAIRQNFIFKGGPGCGKSTAMKQAAQEGLRRQQPMEIIHCSSDPSSLDGVLFLRQGKALYDGTAPHTIDLPFPGAQGGYILPPPFLSEEELVQKADALQQVQQKLSACYRQVFTLTAAAGQVEKTAASAAFGHHRCGPAAPPGRGHHRPGASPGKNPGPGEKAVSLRHHPGGPASL